MRRIQKTFFPPRPAGPTMYRHSRMARANVTHTTTIRPVAAADRGAIAGIYRHHVLHGSASFETAPPAEAEIARRQAALLEQGYPYLVAERGGEVAGYAYAGAYRPRIAYRNTVEDSVYLRPDAAGLGIGSLLLAALIEACEARGFRQMMAVVGDSANASSIRLHQRHGFRCIGTLEAVGYKHGRWLDCVLFQRRLGPGATAPPEPHNA
jgi:L-amino acid N-acyltransferase YncA